MARTRGRTIRKPRREFADQLTAMPDLFLVDRVGRRHPWLAYDVDERARYSVLYFWCPNCESTKRMRLDHRSGRMTQIGGYGYTPGYQFEGLGALFEVERGAINLEYKDRLVAAKARGELGKPRPKLRVVKGAAG